MTRTEQKLEARHQPVTYAAAARRGAETTQARTPHEAAQQPTPRELKSLVVQVKDANDAAGIRRVARTELLSRMKSAGNSHTAEIVEVRRMASGDLLVGTTTEAARQGLEDNQQWLQALSGSAIIKRKIYTVVAHGIRLTRVNTASQAEAIADLERQNRALHQGLRIERLTWPRSAEGKPASSLHIDLMCPKAANRLLDEGLLEDLCIHTCEAFNRAARLTQCFRCQAYSHVARACKSSEKCAHCAGDHGTKECRRADDRSKGRCANCRQPGHTAWMKACPVRSAEIERLQAIARASPGSGRPYARPPPQQTGLKYYGLALSTFRFLLISNIRQLTSDHRPAAASAVWFLRLNLLAQFSWARDQLPSPLA